MLAHLSVRLLYSMAIALISESFCGVSRWAISILIPISLVSPPYHLKKVPLTEQVSALRTIESNRDGLFKMCNVGFYYEVETSEIFVKVIFR